VSELIVSNAIFISFDISVNYFQDIVSELIGSNAVFISFDISINYFQSI
jgi:hypothetical protein